VATCAGEGHELPSSSRHQRRSEQPVRHQHCSSTAAAPSHR